MVTVCQSEGTHQIVISFSPPVVGCLLKKSSQKGGGGGVTGTLNSTPLNSTEVWIMIAIVFHKCLLSYKNSLLLTCKAPKSTFIQR